MFILGCANCGKVISSPLPASVSFWGYPLCVDCVDTEEKRKVIKYSQWINSEAVWHIGSFEDIGLDSGINIDSRIIVENLSVALDVLISPEDLDNRIVDIGCNCGHFLRKLWMRGAKLLHGIEPRWEHLGFAQRWVLEHGAGAIRWTQKCCSDVVPDDIEDSIVLCLGLLYHLDDCDMFFKLLSESTFKYALVESQLWNKEHWEEEGPSLQNAIEKSLVWHPSSEAIEKQCEKFELKCVRIPQYKPDCMHDRGLWKITNGEVKDATDSRLATDES